MTDDKAGSNLEAAALPLLLQRIAIAVFMAVWALDKFVNPQHSVNVFAHFYGIALPAETTWAVGLVQLAIILAFALGFMKRISYLLVFLMHAASTLASWKVYLALFGEGGNLLFWAAIPVLAATFMQYRLRDHDRIALDDHLKKAPAVS
ncbi:MAG: hypothetical protein Kow00104_09270 [Rhodothalassiaceae bacterium]